MGGAKKNHVIQVRLVRDSTRVCYGCIVVATLWVALRGRVPALWGRVPALRVRHRLCSCCESHDAGHTMVTFW